VNCKYFLVSIIVNKILLVSIIINILSNDSEDEIWDFVTGDAPDWGGAFRPVSILPQSELSLLKNYNRRYPRLGSIQTSLDTPQSELSLLRSYNKRCTSWGAFRPVSILPSLSYLFKRL
jgi:hypothetical protein